MPTRTTHLFKSAADTVFDHFAERREDGDYNDAAVTLRVDPNAPTVSLRAIVDEEELGFEINPTTGEEKQVVRRFITVYRESLVAAGIITVPPRAVVTVEGMEYGIDETSETRWDEIAVEIALKRKPLSRQNQLESNGAL